VHPLRAATTRRTLLLLLLHRWESTASKNLFVTATSVFLLVGVEIVGQMHLHLPLQ
jgi:hypothetical protein